MRKNAKKILKVVEGVEKKLEVGVAEGVHVRVVMRVMRVRENLKKKIIYLKLVEIHR